MQHNGTPFLGGIPVTVPASHFLVGMQKKLVIFEKSF
jgi:hypothetical protein